jgi:hypothetical protein
VNEIHFEVRRVVVPADPMPQPATEPFPNLAAAAEVARSRAAAEPPRTDGSEIWWVVTDLGELDYELRVGSGIEIERCGAVEPVADPGAEVIVRHRRSDGSLASMEWRRFLGDRELGDVAAATSARVEVLQGEELPDDFDEVDVRRWILPDGTQVETVGDFRGVSVAAVVMAPKSERPEDVPTLAALVGRAIVRVGDG